MPKDVSTETLMAMPESEIPAALHATLIVLAAPTLQAFPRVARFLDLEPEHGAFDWPRALEEGKTWSSGERALVGAAATIWNGSHDIELRTVLNELDGPSMKRLLLAIEVQRGWRPFRDALERAAEADRTAS
jgi:hypothetical protein